MLLERGEVRWIVKVVNLILLVGIIGKVTQSQHVNLVVLFSNRKFINRQRRV